MGKLYALVCPKCKTPDMVCFVQDGGWACGKIECGWKGESNTTFEVVVIAENRNECSHCGEDELLGTGYCRKCYDKLLRDIKSLQRETHELRINQMLSENVKSNLKEVISKKTRQLKHIYCKHLLENKNEVKS